jgi:polyisoprenoid-binding protein YceI
MTTLTTPAGRTFTGDRDHSSFGFAVRHMTVSTFRGGFADVDARVTLAADGALELTGTARAESISVRTPADLRTHLLGPDFFDAERHPEITFRSAPARPAADGSIEVRGELTMRGVRRPVVATGSLAGPVEDPFGATRAALELRATIDRRDFGMTWSLPLPKGGDALGSQVEITVALELVED